MDLGVARAGFRILATVEIDPHCCQTLYRNHERQRDGTLIVHADIRAVDPQWLLCQLRVNPGEIDLLAGGPPCQAFSQIGKQGGLEDERGLLLFEMVRFADVLRPRAILVEQVKGFVSARDTQGQRGGVLEAFLGELRRLGYAPEWRVLNAADYGVPQLRQRVFLVAMRPPNRFVFPSPSHGQRGNGRKADCLMPHVTVGEALAGLPEPEPVPSGSDPPRAARSHIDITPAGDRKRIRWVPEGGHLAAQHHLPDELRRNLTRKDTTKFRRLSRSEPSLTLRCGEIFFHPIKPRYLTPREYMRLQGFPDDYELCGPVRGRSGRVRYLDQHRQVANSVPPPLAHAVACAIRRALAPCEPAGVAAMR